MHFKYLRYVLAHKWFVFLECWRLGIPWAGIVHDWSKFLPSEWFPYARYFYGPGEPPVLHDPSRRPNRMADIGDYQAKIQADFNQAWLLHQRRNPHHWQYWILMEDNPKSQYTVQAHQPEIGPYFLFDVNRGKQIARFGLGWNCADGESDAVFEAMCDVEQTLARGSVVAIPMPDRFRREMLADWIGAGKAQGKPDTAAWYRENRKRIQLHPETRQWIERALGLSWE